MLLELAVPVWLVIVLYMIGLSASPPTASVRIGAAAPIALASSAKLFCPSWGGARSSAKGRDRSPGHSSAFLLCLLVIHDKGHVLQEHEPGTRVHSLGIYVRSG